MHDFSAAGWLFGSVLLWRILPMVTVQTTSSDTVTRILATIRLLMMLSVIGIVAFGVGRTIAYREYEWSAQAGNSQVTLLIIKHIVFTGIFIPGLLSYRRAGRLLRKVLNENQQ